MIREPIKKFEDLVVWQKGVALLKEIYLCTMAEAFKRDFGSELSCYLCNQIKALKGVVQ